MITMMQETLIRSRHLVATQSGWRTVHNRLRYGPNGPASDMRLRVHPNEVSERYYVSGNQSRIIPHWWTGIVLAGDWDLARRPVEKSAKFGSCRTHFLQGRPWVQTAAWPYGLKRIAKLGKYDACTNEAELAARYARLDDLWDKTKAAGALPPALHVQTTARTGILVHIDRDGNLLFGNQGFHRLSIAKLANLSEIVVVVGVIHPLALSTKAYTELLLRRTI